MATAIRWPSAAGGMQLKTKELREPDVARRLHKPVRHRSRSQACGPPRSTSAVPWGVSGGQVEFSRVRDELMLRPTMPAVERSRQKVPERHGLLDNVRAMTSLKRDQSSWSPELPSGHGILPYRGAGVAFAAGG